MSLAITGSQRNNNGASTDDTTNDNPVINFGKTGKKTTITVNNYLSVMKLVPPPAQPEELYDQFVQGFEKLGGSSGDPWSKVGSHGATTSGDDCQMAEPDDPDVVAGFPYIVNLLMQSKDQMESSEGNHCTATIISPYWVATSESCCEGAHIAVLEFDDWRDGIGGSKVTRSSSKVIPPKKGVKGRKRRSLELYRQRNKRDTGTYDDATCIADGFCKKNGICLIRSGKFSDLSTYAFIKRDVLNLK